MKKNNERPWGQKDWLGRGRGSVGVGERWQNTMGSLEVNGIHYTCMKLPNNNGDGIDKNTRGSGFPEEHSLAGGFAVCI